MPSPRSRAAAVTPAQAVEEAAGRGRTIRVRCTAGFCTNQRAGEVFLREVVPGVLEKPKFLCTTCGCEMKEERHG